MSSLKAVRTAEVFRVPVHSGTKIMQCESENPLLNKK